jgi:Tfp pilus assembly protein PilN
MKAVNLIPAEEGAGARSSGSGIAVYALLGALALLVVMSAVYTLAGRSVQSKQAELTSVSAAADAAETKAAVYKDYAAFANLRKARVETVKSVAGSRFDWASRLHAVARTLPSGTWITSLRATVNPSVAVEGTGDALRPALAVPAIEMVGCSHSHTGVAATVSALRGMSGVQRVSLSDSQAAGDSASSSAGSSSSGTGCGTSPQFSLTVFYAAPAASSTSTTPTTSTTTASGGTTP